MQQPPWFEPYIRREPEPAQLVKITSFKDIEKCQFLPVILVTNVRSLGPKISNFILDFKMREVSVALVSETWGKADKKSYRLGILAMFEKEGLGTISLNRKTRRGGGVAVIFDSAAINIDRLDIVVPFNLEIVWCIGRPRQGAVKDVIFAAFYYPPNSKKKKKMIDHIILTVHMLLVTYPEAEIVIGGDRNELDLAAVTASVPNLRRIITGPTHKKKAIDVILSTLGSLYKQVEVVAPIDPDRPGAKPSDHKVVL